MRVNYIKLSELSEQIKDKKRILLYGAGEYAASIFERINDTGQKNTIVVVDKNYLQTSSAISRLGVQVYALDELKPEYSSEEDILIWGIASPDKLRHHIKNDSCFEECLLVWDLWGFWREDDFPENHKSEFDAAKQLLNDEYSKNVFEAFIMAHKGKIDKDIQYATNGTYFNELTCIEREGAFVDCGSFDGSDSLKFMDAHGKDRKVYAFEPDEENYKRILEKMTGIDNFSCVNKGCWSKDDKLHFTSNGDMSSGLKDEGEDIVEVTSIDKTVGDDKVAFIKMDIEGAEYEALIGAKKTISRDMPVLAISAYHRQDDLIRLIPFIKAQENNHEKYQVFLRHHGVVATELVLYGIPVDREKF